MKNTREYLWKGPGNGAINGGGVNLLYYRFTRDELRSHKPTTIDLFNVDSFEKNAFVKDNIVRLIYFWDPRRRADSLWAQQLQTVWAQQPHFGASTTTGATVFSWHGHGFGFSFGISLTMVAFFISWAHPHGFSVDAIVSFVMITLTILGQPVSPGHFSPLAVTAANATKAIRK